MRMRMFHHVIQSTHTKPMTARGARGREGEDMTVSQYPTLAEFSLGEVHFWMLFHEPVGVYTLYIHDCTYKKK